VLAGLACDSLRSEARRRAEAVTGRFTGHHALLLAQMLNSIDALTADIATIQRRIDTQIAELTDAGGPTRRTPLRRSPRRAGNPGRDRHRHDPHPDPGAWAIAGSPRVGCSDPWVSRYLMQVSAFACLSAVIRP
jgi:hypothetical protein